jgi:hypothetical protein
MAKTLTELLEEEQKTRLAHAKSFMNKILKEFFDKECPEFKGKYEIVWRDIE